jgi:hypothetical protein
VPVLLDPANVALREEVLGAILVRARQDPVFGWELLTGGGGDPTVTAAPTTGLVDGQVVEVSGTGFLPGVPVGVAVCPAGVLDARRCSASEPWSTTADGRGRFTLSVAAVRIVSGDGFATSVDCAVEACVLVLGDPGGGRVVRVPLAFQPDP